MQERYINYLVRTYKLFFIELIICHDRDLLLLLVEELRRQRRQREMQHFVVKYELKQFQMHFRKEEREDLLRIRNVLLDQD